MDRYGEPEKAPDSLEGVDGLLPRLALLRLMDKIPRGSRYPNSSVSGPKIHTLNGFWTLKPYYLGTWTLKVLQYPL